MATKKRKPVAKRAPREDFNQAAHRIIQHVIDKPEKPEKPRKQSAR